MERQVVKTMVHNLEIPDMIVPVPLDMINWRDRKDVLVIAGGEVSWTYEIINKSNVELTAVTVVDDMGTPDESGDDQLICEVEVLPPGETNLVSCQHSGRLRLGAARFRTTPGWE